MGNYEKAVAAYDRMAQRYFGQPDHWTAIAGTVSSYTGLHNEAKVREGVKMIRDGMKQMDLETQRDMEQHIRNVETSLQKV